MERVDTPSDRGSGSELLRRLGLYDDTPDRLAWSIAWLAAVCYNNISACRCDQRRHPYLMVQSVLECEKYAHLAR